MNDQRRQDVKQTTKINGPHDSIEILVIENNCSEDKKELIIRTYNVFVVVATTFHWEANHASAV